MVVVVILGILAAMVVPKVLDRPDQARATAARQDISGLMQALKLYRLDQGRYPSQARGLKVLAERPADASASNWRSYLERLPNDPWGKPYQYLNPGVNGEIDVFSLGADGQPGGEGINADIGSGGSERAMNGHRQRGMAIISALLIVTVVAVIAAGLIARQSAFIRALESEQLRIQAGWMLRGGLEWSRQLLLEDSRRDPLTRLDQRWAQPMRGLRLSSAELPFNGQLEDEQGKFNLRNLLVDQRPDLQERANFRTPRRSARRAPEGDSADRRAGTRFYARLPAEAPPAETQPAGFDSGRETSPGAVLRALPARMPALRRLDDLARLGIPPATLERLRPYVTILPETTWINGNTARAEVLAACVPGLGLDQARRVLGERDRGRWFLNRGDFVNRLNMPQLQAQSVKVGITSDWFLLTAYARRDRQEVRLQALVQRKAGESTAVNWVGGLMKATWRCLLPPLSEFAEAAPLPCLRLDARGAVQERIEASLAELARRRQGLPVALFLHPRDCRLVSLELPALPAAKLAAAVNCAAEALVLGDPAQLRLAHGPRGADGRLTLGWLEASALASLEQAVQRLRLDVRCRPRRSSCRCAMTVGWPASGTAICCCAAR